MKNIFILLTIIALAIGGCKEDEQIVPTGDEKAEMKVSINHTFDNEELVFLSNEYTLASGEKVKFKRLAYILADFYLVKADDSKVYLNDQYALLNPKTDPSSFILTNIPIGEYKAFGFSIGLDSNINHGDPNKYPTSHPLSPINNSLHWSWQGGYIFTALEGDVSNSTDNFVFHIAGSNNKLDFELPLNFTKNNAALNATLKYNVAEVFKSPEVYSIENDGGSTHNTTDPVTLKLIRNMEDVFQLVSISE